MNKIKLGFIGLLLTFTSFGVVATAAAVAPNTAVTPVHLYAAVDSTAKRDACAGLAQLDTTQSCATGKNKVAGVVKSAVGILSYVVGIAAVIMVIVAGFKYTTSGGDSNKISSAKTTLVYALIGLVVAALAQVLVHTVINDSAKVSKTANNSVSAPARFTA